MSAVDLSFDHYKLITGDALRELRNLPDECVQSVTTSPPYFALRDYGTEHQIYGGTDSCDHTWGEEIPGNSRGGSGPGSKEKRVDDSKSSYGRSAGRGSICTSCDAWRGELGLEPEPQLFINHMVMIFREVRRVLRKDGTVFLNIADTFNGSGAKHLEKAGNTWGLKPKDLCGIPHRLVQALQTDGWYWRSDAVWSKAGGNCPKCYHRMEKGSSLPEPVKDRFARAHEYVFLLAKSKKYYFDDEAVKEPHTSAKRRDVFYISSQNFRGAHHATMPESLAKICVLGGTSEHGACARCQAPYKRVTSKGAHDTAAQKKAGGDDKGEYHGENTKDYDEHKAQKPSDVKRRILEGMRKITTTGWAQTCKCELPGDPVPCVVLDPFSGAATTGAVAVRHGRKYIGIELMEDHNENIAKPRLDAEIAERMPPAPIDYLPTNSSNVYQGDAMKLLERVPPASARLILTDPPYNVSRENNFASMGRGGINFSWDGGFDQEKWLHLADKALMPGGSIVVWNDWKNLGDVARTLEGLGYSVKRNLVWRKTNAMPRNRDRSFIQTTELALWAVKPKGKWVFNRRAGQTYEDGIFSYGVPRAKKGRPRHESKKPDGLFEEIIGILSDPDDLVLDPFAGGGTTAFAAERMGRRHISFELDPGWYEEAVRHWVDADSSKKAALEALAACSV